MALCLFWRWALCEHSCCQGNHCWAHTGCAGVSEGPALNTPPTGGRAARSRWGTDAPHTRDLQGRTEGSCPEERTEPWAGGRADDHISPGRTRLLNLCVSQKAAPHEQINKCCDYMMLFWWNNWPWSSGRVRWRTGRRCTPPPSGCREETANQRDDTTSRVRWLKERRNMSSVISFILDLQKTQAADQLPWKKIHANKC